MSDATPMMSQYLSIKAQHRDAVLFFRLGDFYEMFNEDAIEVSRLLNLTLTQRGGNPMCGIPYHANRVYIARLLRAGKKIAICEQLSVPGPGKGLADRRVTEVITPGTAVDDEYIDQSANNYLAALSVSRGRRGDEVAFAYVDVTTGEFAATRFSAAEAELTLRRELGRVRPREMLVQQSLLATEGGVARVIAEVDGIVINKYPDWSFNGDAAAKRLRAHFGTVGLGAFSLADDSPEIPPAALLLEYLESTAGATLAHVEHLRVYREGEFVSLDDATRKNLELEQNLRDGGSSYTLFETLSATQTAMGTRLLRSWIAHPLVDRAEIDRRLDAVESLYRAQAPLARVRERLSTVLDVERLTARVSMERAHGKDLVALRQSLTGALEVESILAGAGLPGLSVDGSVLEAARSVRDLVERSIREDSPSVLAEGGMIKEGWSAELDELKSLRDNSSAVLEAYLEEERARTGIQNLRVRYNRMIGYYLEVTKGNISSVPAHFIKRRSLSNGDRYTTERLAELETELNDVDARIVECERREFVAVRDKVRASASALLALARAVSRVDVLQSFAWCATARAWTRPEFAEDGVLEIEEGRHPVVERHLPSGEFVPNGIALSSAPDSATPSFALITGPNMAGKSTFLRQTALIVVMAQIGSFVPASRARITPVDRVFCRVGASDNLARGESTFLVEMTETAHILRAATRDSLVIMDEVGRGTSTEDGLSIAQAVTEFLLDSIGSKTLFATHYHELSRLRHPRMGDWCLDVLERDGTVVFLKRVRPGASDNSYGIHVARLAGVPEQVLSRAEDILAGLAGRERAVSPPDQEIPVAPRPSPKPAAAGLFSEEELVIDEILSADPERMTPIEALAAVDRWRKRLFPSSK
jgi:DNA mismatch repair protein MutS